MNKHKRENETKKEQGQTTWQDAWIAKLVPDPAKEMPDVLLLCGYVGASSDKKAIRLYYDAQLLQCVDIPVDSVLHREAIPTTASTLGGSYIWIERAAWATCKAYRTCHVATQTVAK